LSDPDRIERIERYLHRHEDAIEELRKENIDLRRQIAAVAATVARNNTSVSGEMNEAAQIARAVEDATAERGLFPRVELDPLARRWFIWHLNKEGKAVDPSKLTRYVNRCSIFNAINAGLRRHQDARGRCRHRVVMKDFWKWALVFFQEQAAVYPCQMIINARVLERVMKSYNDLESFGDSRLNDFKDVSGNYLSVLNGNIGNNNRRKRTTKLDRFVLALWIDNKKPFVSDVHRLYNEFVMGKRELVDKETGEIYRSKDFRYKGRPVDLSKASVWNIIKDPVNEAATADKTKGHYHATVENRPFVFRKSPEMSLSKISMDDADLSRKLKNGTRVHRYMAVDVASGYWFEPVYSTDTLTAQDVLQCMKNMFCELLRDGLPLPGEIEHEHHLMDKVMKLGEEHGQPLKLLFPFTTISSHSRNKRAEHFIKGVKWGVAHANGHTRGRFYGRGRYRTEKVKVSGDFKEPGYEFAQIVSDDLRDIDQYNNMPHPNRERYGGKTRREVFMENINRDLPTLAMEDVVCYVGNRTKTEIRNNNHMSVNGNLFLLDDFESLKKLSPNNKKVTAYWIPDNDGHVEYVYLYSEMRYIGRATTVDNYRFNEAKAEMTEQDVDRMRRQLGRISRYDGMMRRVKDDIPKIEVLSKSFREAIKASEQVEAVPENLSPSGGSGSPSETVDYVLQDPYYNPEEIIRRAREEA
jgi:hypothetical protein